LKSSSHGRTSREAGARHTPSDDDTSPPAADRHSTPVHSEIDIPVYPHIAVDDDRLLDNDVAFHLDRPVDGDCPLLAGYIGLAIAHRPASEIHVGHEATWGNATGMSVYNNGRIPNVNWLIEINSFRQSRLYFLFEPRVLDFP
jgi:hypothetical protein